MRHILSDLLLPVLRQASREPLETRLALRLYLMKLQDTIADQASSVANSRSSTPVARRFQEIALRGDLEAVRKFFTAEHERNRPATSSLAKDALNWLAEDGPVQKCIEKALIDAKAEYEPLPFPLDENQLLSETLSWAAKREFLAQAFGRLIQ